jgi:hypothetical protein
MGAWVSMEPRQRSVSARLTEVGVDMDLVSENLINHWINIGFGVAIAHVGLTIFGIYTVELSVFTPYTYYVYLHTDICIYI